MREYFIWLFKFLTIFFMIFLIIPLFLAIVASVGKLTSGEPGQDPKKSVAVVELTGMIEDSKDIIKEIYKQHESTKVRGIVLRVNSPGGAVAPSQDIFKTIKDLNERNPKKPIVASLGALAASGGFYSVLGAKKIYAQPGTLTGSIGVLLQIPMVREITDKIGFQMVTIKSGRLKDVGNSFREMTENERVFLQDTANTVHEQFILDVAAGRKKPAEEIRRIADGRVILGSQAKDLGLVDEIGDVYDAARSVFELLGEPLKPDEIPNLIYKQEKLSELKDLLNSAASFVNLFSRTPQFRYEMY